MWLLNTARAELKFFPTPEGIPGGYAILSHVWDEHEQSFQDIQALRERCAKDGTNPRDLASDKIRNFCILAERDGCQWGWDDTCCIDKTSSTDLSEAITAMYRYYSLADVCYAYLRDVPTDCDLHAPGSAFRKSRWHQRGIRSSSYCVAARMAWAASRETTRPEDEAYCLMGLFGIFMPPLYGEGENAFLRLQEEIVRRVDDPSIFAWGGSTASRTRMLC
uniref:Reducing polyketide synthase BOA6 (Polyketide synthase 6) (PKS6)) n=1 Tax=Ganoderma boninense TaxID=34458 RepID=A0A5K1JRZ7_9APHY|nr:Reducing polyketide synthase BOA6 (EC (Botcinic acid biosynthesis cluster A protein 6) (Polyketide synthase 6) (PKS6) [Ganoderma boninense]